MKEPKQVRIEVKQGRVVVNSAHVYAESDSIVCIYVDLASKRASLFGVSDVDGITELIFEADENTLHVDTSQPENSFTCVTFPDYKDWFVFSVDGPNRYTLSLVMVAPK